MRNFEYFEYDENKSQSNFAKHGIDFIEAQKLWNDPNLLEIPSRIQDEPRFVVIGKINSKHWSGVIEMLDLSQAQCPLAAYFIVPTAKCKFKTLTGTDFLFSNEYTLSSCVISLCAYFWLFRYSASIFCWTRGCG